ncbi:MAG: hypothetical protein V4792_18765 [Pseudomonadota bacterium]
MKRIITLSILALVCTAALAKLPVSVLSDEAKAKAAEAAAKTAHGNKLADFQLCKSMERVALRYQAEAKKAGKDAKPPTATPPCADPGAFVYPPPAATAAAPAPAPAAAPTAKAPEKKA